MQLPHQHECSFDTQGFYSRELYHYFTSVTCSLETHYTCHHLELLPQGLAPALSLNPLNESLLRLVFFTPLRLLIPWTSLSASSRPTAFPIQVRLDGLCFQTHSLPVIILTLQPNKTIALSHLSHHFLYIYTWSMESCWLISQNYGKWCL